MHFGFESHLNICAVIIKKLYIGNEIKVRTRACHIITNNEIVLVYRHLQ